MKHLSQEANRNFHSSPEKFLQALEAEQTKSVSFLGSTETISNIMGDPKLERRPSGSHAGHLVSNPETFRQVLEGDNTTNITLVRGSTRTMTKPVSC